MEVTKVNRKLIYDLCMTHLEGEQLTARELAIKILEKTGLLDGTRQAVAPRLTELERLRKVRVVGSKVDEMTHKRVSVYEVIEQD